MNLADPDIRRLRDSVAVIARDPARAGACFYDHLFKSAPQVRALFPADLDPQGRKLTAMLALAVAHIDDWRALGPALDALARRHVGYGAEPGHYSAVGEALLRMVAEIDADGALDDNRRAWSIAYAAISARMIAAANGLTGGADGTAASAPPTGVSG